jgi:tRNA U54 and U55 pseudouridine synthase Pus10
MDEHQVQANSEEAVLDSLDRQWKGKYPVTWCHLCDTAIIICPKCNNSSCNGGGCPECHNDFEEFAKTCKTDVDDYLTERETFTYRKGLRLQRLIVESIQRQEKQLDFNELKNSGHLSQADREMFCEVPF